jgi:predicted amidophosphoribosyltransferase
MSLLTLQPARRSFTGTALFWFLIMLQPSTPTCSDCRQPVEVSRLLVWCSAC